MKRAAVVIAVVILGACGIEVVGQAPRGAGETDAGADARDSRLVAPPGPNVDPGAPPPAAPPPASLQDAAVDSSLATCPGGSFVCESTQQCVTDCSAACAAAPWTCGSSGRCIADCTACTGRTHECLVCDPGGAPTKRECLQGPSGCFGDRCSGCTGQGRSCPGMHQICVGNVCFSCGESGTAGLGCERLGQCNASADRCE